MSKKSLDWDLPGLIVPPLTAFRADGGVDFAVMEQQIDYIIEAARPAALCVLGVEAQEYQYLGEEERREVIRRCAGFIGRRRPFVVGVSHAAFRRSQGLAALAGEVGAAAIQVLIPNRPSGGKPTTAEVVRYFAAIARESALPIVAYHNPGPGAELGLAAIVELAKLDAVVAIKESSRNQRYLGLLIKDVEAGGLAHVFATMEVLLPSLELGASGGTMPPPGAALCAILLEAFRRGDGATAVRVHRLLAEMPARWIDHGLVAVMKSSMRSVGLDCGTCYPPFGEVPAADAAAIAALWAEVEHAFPGSVRYRDPVKA